MIINSMQRNGLILAAFALAATFLVLGTAWLTEDRIQAQAQQQLQQNLDAVLPASAYTNNLLDHCLWVSDPALGSSEPQRVFLAFRDQAYVGAAIETIAPNGYSGTIELLVAVWADQSVAGVRTLKHAETPGLGDKIERRKSDWIESFTGMRVNSDPDPRWAVQREGGVFDQFTGATITPRAVIDAVERTVRFAQQQQAQWQQQPPAGCAAAEAGAAS